MAKSKRPSRAVVNVGGFWPEVDSYWLLGVSGAVVANGFFVDLNGNRTGSPIVNLAIPQFLGVNNAPVRLAVMFPTLAVGAIVNLSGDVYFDLQDNEVATAHTEFINAATWGPRIKAVTAMYNEFGGVG